MRFLFSLSVIYLPDYFLVLGSNYVKIKTKIRGIRNVPFKNYQLDSTGSSLE